jgi:putative ABC transport system permease protein
LSPFAQLPWFGGTLLIRSATDDPLAIKTAVQQAIWSVNKALPESKAETLEQMLSGQVAEPRLYTFLLGIFAATALLLAAIGIYGVMAYSVAQRTHEFGIRLALGAQQSDVLKLVIGQGMKLVLFGVAIGLVAAFGLTRLLKSWLFGVSATDPLTFGLIALLLAAVAFCGLLYSGATGNDS